VTDDALRSLTASQRLLGTEEIVVVMHDGCGLHGASEKDLGAFDDLDAPARSYRHATTSAASSSTRRPARCVRCRRTPARALTLAAVLPKSGIGGLRQDSLRN
jgi:carbonic anhydrase